MPVNDARVTLFGLVIADRRRDVGVLGTIVDLLEAFTAKTMAIPGLVFLLDNAYKDILVRVCECAGGPVKASPWAKCASTYST